MPADGGFIRALAEISPDLAKQYLRQYHPTEALEEILEPMPPKPEAKPASTVEERNTNLFFEIADVLDFYPHLYNQGTYGEFLLPDGTGRPLLTWAEADRAPWGVIMMFGGGLALAAGMGASGLADWLGQELLPLRAAPLVVVALALVALVVLVTEFASNVATASAIMPVVASLAVALGTEVNESGFQTGLYPGNAAFIDVGLFLLP